jgi:hypothetical protein
VGKFFEIFGHNELLVRRSTATQPSEEDQVAVLRRTNNIIITTCSHGQQTKLREKIVQ